MLSLIPRLWMRARVRRWQVGREPAAGGRHGLEIGGGELVCFACFFAASFAAAGARIALVCSIIDELLPLVLALDVIDPAPGNEGAASVGGALLCVVVTVVVTEMVVVTVLVMLIRLGVGTDGARKFLASPANDVVPTDDELLKLNLLVELENAGGAGGRLKLNENCFGFARRRPPPKPRNVNVGRAGIGNVARLNVGGLTALGTLVRTGVVERGVGGAGSWKATGGRARDAIGEGDGGSTCGMSKS
jgi:hypothetical protein